MFYFGYFPMEAYSHHHKPHAEYQVTQALERVIEGVFSEVRARRMDHIMKNEMPQDYLKYIGNVSMMLHSHREPPSTRLLHKVITEPSEAESRQMHQLPQQSRFIRLTEQREEQEESLPKQQLKLTRKPSSCLSQRSRGSIQRQPSKKTIKSKRTLFDNCRLVPLGRGNEMEQVSEAYEERITQLRKRKVKLEEAMRAFRQEDRSEKVAEYKKSKENNIAFTTDFKGKVVNFNPRITKARPNDTIPFTVKFETLVQSGRSWGNWGKVNATTRRNLFRDISRSDQCDE